MKEITVQELKQKMDANESIQIIDVRESYEYDIVNISGTLIPMGETIDRVDEFAKDKDVIVHCRSGKRSAAVIDALERNHGFENLYNLKGGILAYAAEIDPSLPSY